MWLGFGGARAKPVGRVVLSDVEVVVHEELRIAETFAERGERVAAALVDLHEVCLHGPQEQPVTEVRTRFGDDPLKRWYQVRDRPVGAPKYKPTTDAPQVLADRLARSLPQRQEYGDVRCDDRVLLDSGRDCPRREDRQDGRRAQRRAVAADVAMPHAAEAERRATTTWTRTESRMRAGAVLGLWPAPTICT